VPDRITTGRIHAENGLSIPETLRNNALAGSPA
jgi:hypothetical protein